MTEDVLPPQVFQQFAPENVAPAALYLVSDDAPTNMIIGAGAGVFHASYLTVTAGVVLPPEQRTPEGVAAHWRSEEHTSALRSLLRTSSTVFCQKQKTSFLIPII